MYTHMCVSGEKIHRTVREMRVPVYMDTHTWSLTARLLNVRCTANHPHQ